MAQIQAYRGISFTGLLTIVFIIMKLMNYITWSWIWVLSPLWISFGAACVIFTLIAIIAIIVNK